MNLNFVTYNSNCNFMILYVKGPSSNGDACLLMFTFLWLFIQFFHDQWKLLNLATVHYLIFFSFQFLASSLKGSSGSERSQRAEQTPDLVVLFH